MAALRIGDEVFVFCLDHLRGLEKGRIAALTMEPGKHVGIELEHPHGVHTLDGRVKDKHGLWVTPDHVFIEEEIKKLEAEHKAKATVAPEIPPVELELVTDETGRKVMRPKQD